MLIFPRKVIQLSVTGTEQLWKQLAAKLTRQEKRAFLLNLEQVMGGLASHTSDTACDPYSKN